MYRTFTTTMGSAGSSRVNRMGEINSSEIDIITFDCYGTLIDWESGIVNAFRAEAAKDGVVLSRGDIVQAYMIEEPAVEAEEYRRYRDVLALTAVRVAKWLGWSIDEERGKFLPASLPGWKPFPDTNAALGSLAKRFQLGILSNIDDDLLAATRRHFAVRFDLIVTAEQVKSFKPGPAHFREAVSRADGKRILHVAQSYFHDIVPANAMGIPVVWVNRKKEKVGEGKSKATLEVHNLAELADQLQ